MTEPSVGSWGRKRTRWVGELVKSGCSVTVPAVTDTPQGRVVWEGQAAPSLLSLQLLCKPQLISKYVFVERKTGQNKTTVWSSEGSGHI